MTDNTEALPPLERAQRDEAKRRWISEQDDCNLLEAYDRGWKDRAALAQCQQVPEGLTELMRHVRRLMAHVDDWQRWYGSADVLLRHQLPLPPAGTVRVMEDLSEAIGRASAALTAAPSAQAEQQVPLTREKALEVIGNVSNIGDALRILRATEAAHGIGKQEGE